MDETNTLHNKQAAHYFKQMLVRAMDDTWLYQTGGPDNPEEELLARWGKITQEQDLLRILQQGKERHRAFALFALGHLHSPETQAILVRYLHSAFLWERWASALALGRWGNEEALLAFLTLLQEDDSLDQWITAGNPNVLDDFYRRSHHRFEMVSRLGDWGDPRTVPTLYHLLKKSAEEGTRLKEAFKTRGLDLYALEDHLAYALGQLGAWGSLRDLPWSPHRQRIATIFMVLGALQIHQEHPFIREQFFNPECAEDALEHLQRNHTHLEDYERQREEILTSRFGYTQEEQAFLLEHFAEDCRRRLEDLWFDGGDEAGPLFD